MTRRKAERVFRSSEEVIETFFRKFAHEGVEKEREPEREGELLADRLTNEMRAKLAESLNRERY